MDDEDELGRLLDEFGFKPSHSRSDDSELPRLDDLNELGGTDWRPPAKDDDDE